MFASIAARLDLAADLHAAIRRLANAHGALDEAAVGALLAEVRPRLLFYLPNPLMSGSQLGAPLSAEALSVLYAHLGRRRKHGLAPADFLWGLMQGLKRTGVLVRSPGPVAPAPAAHFPPAARPRGTSTAPCATTRCSTRTTRAMAWCARMSGPPSSRRCVIRSPSSSASSRTRRAHVPSTCAVAGFIARFIRQADLRL